ncbi:hypothetical protein, partial [Pedobacter cryoconitis]|uniref:hypothetical protein n=1 Tax=Pedobacter cryoconitis TaxID=188932 RepID=UPI001C879943
VKLPVFVGTAKVEIFFVLSSFLFFIFRSFLFLPKMLNHNPTLHPFNPQHSSFSLFPFLRSGMQM